MTPEPQQALRSRIEAILGDGNRDVPRLAEYDWSESDKTLIIRWAINDNFSSNWIMTGAQTDVTDMLKEIDQSGLMPEYQFVTFVGTFAMQDAYGNVSEDRVITASYDKATVDKINWDNFLYTNIWTIADQVSIHPAFND